MTPDEYVQLAIRTESRPNEEMQLRVSEQTILRVLHGSMGLVTEAGELMDSLKRLIYYGKSLDTVNLIEELGDILWYVAIITDQLGISLETVMEKNIAKLKKRYPDKFDKEKAITRDLDAEYQALKQDTLAEPFDGGMGTTPTPEILAGGPYPEVNQEYWNGARECFVAHYHFAFSAPIEEIRANWDRQLPEVKRRWLFVYNAALKHLRGEI